ncbi:MAG: hypothetical protein JW772_03240 [Candidatus Diapherotrites archaeon]|nr:hypothetical protein [Candidatus Diapherotrites archaeon]
MSEEQLRQPKEISREDKELFDLLSPAHTVDIKVEKLFEELPKRFIILLLEKMKEHYLVNVRLLKYFAQKNMTGVYVSINWPVTALFDALKSEKVDPSKFFFVDTITKMTGEPTMSGKNLLYVDSPKNLIDLSVAIEMNAEQIKEPEKFVIIDSLSTLIVYNKANVAEKFVHSMSAKMRAWKAKGIFLMMDDVEPEVINTISQFCDRTIKL